MCGPNTVVERLFQTLMHTLTGFLAALALTAMAGAAAAADTCDAVQSQVQANIAGKGITDFSVTVVDQAAEVPGQVVGHCANGSKKIVYLRGAAPGSAPVVSAAPGAVAKPVPPKTTVKAPVKRAVPMPDHDVLTECKDGSVIMGGNCKR